MAEEMENRWSKRQATDMPARIYHNKQLVAESSIRDFSLEGMFLSNASPMLTSNTHIEIAFDLDHNDGSIAYRLPAMVRHSNENGIGIMFLHFNAKTFRHFQYALYEKTTVDENVPCSEQRWSPRKPARLEVALYQMDKKIVDSTVGNLTGEGMFIKTAYSPAIHSLFTLEFSLPADDQSTAQRFRIPCLVCHSNNHGIGLMFVRFQPALSHALRHLLSENVSERDEPLQPPFAGTLPIH
ncbi:MAG: hypothetical protein GXP17_04985 [Gammaproteobacteria bacterium]|nr:hypothetical protein [Gammaproteobacteria bacterium]